MCLADSLSVLVQVSLPLSPTSSHVTTWTQLSQDPWLRLLPATASFYSAPFFLPLVFFLIAVPRSAGSCGFARPAALGQLGKSGCLPVNAGVGAAYQNIGSLFPAEPRGRVAHVFRPNALSVTAARIQSYLTFYLFYTLILN